MGQLWPSTTQTPDLQKRKLLGHGRALPLGLFPPSVGINHLVGQAQELCLSHVPGHNCKLVLETGDCLNRPIGLPVSRSQQGGTLSGLLS
jgi:hypothetical protein